MGMQVMEVLSRYARFMDADLQQRAVEYMGLVMHPDVAKRNVASKPPWEKRGSLLLRRLMHRAVRFPDISSLAIPPFPPPPPPSSPFRCLMLQNPAEFLHAALTKSTPSLYTS